MVFVLCALCGLRAHRGFCGELNQGAVLLERRPKTSGVLDSSGIMSAGRRRSRDRRVSLGVSTNRVLPPRPGLDCGIEPGRNRGVSDRKLCCLKMPLITSESISVVAAVGEWSARLPSTTRRSQASRVTDNQMIRGVVSEEPHPLSHPVNDGEA